MAAAVANATDSVGLHNETTGSQSRYTKDGRKISYQLDVVQQPIRARACGQGAKSSSDRRPVDPPPIISLRISDADKRDITCNHNASLFLYATLETARHIAQGRIQGPAPNAPVLTGSPVAGISYLDRPEPAGYFIFPDLSVRHEGKYRICFTLYEEVKDPRDADPESPPNQPPGSHVYARCEVKTAPFDVYSAKKFPGLMESTILSRTVADQGCRVRIRRDIRMRKRDSKADEKYSYEPQQPQATSYDNTKLDSKPAFPAQDDDASDHTAMAANTGAHAMPSQPAATQSNSYQQQPYGLAMPTQSHQPIYTQIQSYDQQQQQQQQPSQSFGQQPAYHHQQQQTSYMQQQQQQPPPPPPPAPQQQQQQTQQQPPAPQQSQYAVAQYQNYPSNYFPQTAQSQTGPSMHHTYGYQPQPAQQQQQQMMQNAYAAQPYMDMRTDGQTYGAQYGVSGAPHQPYGSQSQMAPLYNSMEQQPVQPMTQSTDRSVPAPLKIPDASQARPETHTSPLTSAGAGRLAGQTKLPVPQFSTQATAGSGSKRAYDSTFSTRHFEKPLRSGERPQFDSATEEADASDEDMQDLESLRISYRRADGTFTMVEPRLF